MTAQELLILLVVSVTCMLQSRGGVEENPLRLIRYEAATTNLDASIVVSASPLDVNETQRWVTVSWKNVPNPSKLDWIGLWSLYRWPVITPDKQAPIKYQFCSMSPSHMESGSGQLKFYMVNMRQPLQFGLLRGGKLLVKDQESLSVEGILGLTTPVLAAHSEYVTFSNYMKPMHGHLSFTKNYTEMALTYVTLNKFEPQVKWGRHSGQYEHTKTPTSDTYFEEDMCDAPANGYGYHAPGMIHKTVMDGLVPGTKYYYIFGSGEGDEGFSEERMFIAPPVPSPNATTSILAYGDLGHGVMDDTSEFYAVEPPSLKTTKRLIAEVDRHDFVMHVGDISYAEGYSTTWDEFFDQLSPVMDRLPYMVNTGNHESDSRNSDSYYQGHDSGGECNVPFVKRFAMPRQSDKEPWYSFEYGSVAVVMMSTEHDFRNSSKQWSALDKYLATVDRSRTPWLIFSGHRAMYVDLIFGNEATRELREHVEPLLMKYKVDLALWGHFHFYQRTCPVYKEKCTSGAPVHVIIGMAGQYLAAVPKPIKPSYVEFLDIEHYGYTRIVTNATTLTMEYVRNVDGAVADSFSLHKH